MHLNSNESMSFIPISAYYNLFDKNGFAPKSHPYLKRKDWLD